MEDCYDEKPEKTLLKEHALSRNASCVGMVDEAAYLHLFDYRKGVGRLACFEMKTGNFYWVKMNDEAFLKLCYNDEKYESYLDAYEGREDNYYNDFYYPKILEMEAMNFMRRRASDVLAVVVNDFCEGLTGYPSEDKEYSGEFCERKR